MSVIYEVEHVHTGDRMALKVLRRSVGVLDEAAIARFRREARVSSLVKSEHIVRVFDAGIAAELEDAPYLVMDLLDGQDLAEISGREPQPPALVTEWLQQAARGVEKAHAVGIVHRDLKPENLFSARRHDGGSLLVVLDFGVAKLTQDSGIEMTQDGAVLGTPLYMSPEQAAGDSARVGPSSDVWAFGLIAYRLLTGNNYWHSTALSALLAEIASRPAVAPSLRGAALGDRFDAWFLRSCARHAAHRFQGVREQIDALAAALDAPGERHERVNEAWSRSIGQLDAAPLALEPPNATLRSRTATVAQRLAVSLRLVLSFASTRRRLRAMSVVAGCTVAAAWLAFSLSVHRASPRANAQGTPPSAPDEPIDPIRTPAAVADSIPLELRAHREALTPAATPASPPAAAPLVKVQRSRRSPAPERARGESSPAMLHSLPPAPPTSAPGPVPSMVEVRARTTPVLDPLQDPR